MALYFFKLSEQPARLENKYGVEFRKTVPTFGNVHNLMWHVFSWMRGKLFFEYQAVKDGKVTIRLESDNGLAVYGPRFGRLPFGPRVR